MPFTPFHLGPGLLIAMLLFPYVDVIVVLVASIIIDLEPAYYLFVHGYPYHGFLHSFVGSSLVALLLSVAMYPIRGRYLRILELFGLKQETNFRKIVLSSLIGTNFHIFLDSFLYPEMKPFLPLQENPLLYCLSPSAIYEFCLFAFAVGFLIYIARIIKKIKG